MRGAKTVSPVPTVTEAMIAPGPNTDSSASQPPLISRDGGGYSNASACVAVVPMADSLAKIFWRGSLALAGLYSRSP